MTRPSAISLAFALLAALPAPGPAQTAKQLYDGRSGVGAGTDGWWDMNDWNAYTQAGWRAIRRGYYQTAEHEFLSAIDASKRAGGADKRLLAKSYADYAWALQKQGRNAEAEPLLRWSLVARQATLDKTSTAIAQNLNQLATLYYDLGRLADAEPLLYRAIDNQLSAPKPDVAEQGRSRTLLGLVLAGQRRYAEAEPHFAKAVALRERSPGPGHPETGDALANLAWTLHDQGKDDEARPLFERALRIFERTRDESDPSIAHAAHGLGRILARQGKPAEAEADFRRAIAILEEAPDGGPSLLEVLRHYADLLEAQGRADDMGKVKARLAPLRAKYTGPPAKLGAWYRSPEHSGAPGIRPAGAPSGSGAPAAAFNPG